MFQIADFSDVYFVQFAYNPTYVKCKSQGALFHKCPNSELFRRIFVHFLFVFFKVFTKCYLLFLLYCWQQKQENNTKGDENTSSSGWHRCLKCQVHLSSLDTVFMRWYLYFHSDFKRSSFSLINVKFSQQLVLK